MDNVYTVGDLNPFTKTNIKEWEGDWGMSLPRDYQDFLCSYGLGDFNGILIISDPDKDHFRSTFADDMDLWELSDAQSSTILKGVTIAKTVDGDIVLLIKDDQLPIVIMPRHSEEPVYLKNFSQLINLYQSTYNWEIDQLYFDSHYNYRMKSFTEFVSNGVLDKALFDSIHDHFKMSFSLDKVVGKQQPSYIIQSIGGWVYFDALHKGSIRIKYQEQHQEKAKEIIEMLGSRMKN